MLDVMGESKAEQEAKSPFLLEMHPGGLLHKTACCLGFDLKQ